MDRRERLDGVGAADRLDSRFRKAEVLYLPLPDQVLHRSGDIFDWHCRVNSVLIVQVDRLDSEPLE